MTGLRDIHDEAAVAAKHSRVLLEGTIGTSGRMGLEKILNCREGSFPLWIERSGC